jgi:hypothetical protein
MSDEIEVGVSASGKDGVDKLTAAIDNFSTALDKLGKGGSTSLDKLGEMMNNMQATMVTGFTEMAALAQKSNAKVEQDRSSSLARIEAMDQKNFDRRRAQEQNQQVALATIRAKEASSIEAAAEKIEAQDAARAARRRAQEQKQQVDLATIREAALEKQRVLDTAFLTSSLAQQAAFAEKAKIYASLGGNAAAKFGGAAAGADLGAIAAQVEAAKALEAAHKALAPAVTRSSLAQAEQNALMRDAQGVFRGAAHEAGLYGLAHGQLIALLAGGALAGALHKIATEGAEVEYSLQFLKSFSDEVKPLDFDRFIGISSGTLSNITEAAKGIRALSEAGLNQEQALSALPDLLRLSALGELSVAQAAEVAVESLRAFGLGISDVAQVSDVLIAVSTKTNISVKTLANDLKTTSTTFAEFGGNMKDAAVLTGALAEKGLSVAPLSTALTALIEPSKKQAEVLKQIGFNAKDANNNIKPLLQVVSEFNTAVSKYHDAADIFAPLGGPRAAKALQAVSDSKEILELMKAVDESAGKTFDAYLKQIDTVEGSFKQLASTVQGDFVKAFEEANPLIREAEASLIHLAESKGVQDFLSALAVVVSRLTNLVLDHIEALKYLALGYAALKIISTVSTSLEILAVRMAASTVATTELTVASGMQGTALAALGIEAKAAAVSTGLLGAGSVTAAEGLGLAAVASRGLLAALGPISLVIGVATLAYELWNSSVSAGEKATLSATTRTEQMTDALAKHTAELKKNNDELLLNAQIKAGGSAPGVFTSTLTQGLLSGSSAIAQQQQELVKQQAGLDGEKLQENIRQIIELHQQDLAIQQKLATLDQNDVSIERARMANQVEVKRTANLQEGLTVREAIKKLEDAPSQVKASAAAEAKSRLADIQKEAEATAGQVAVTGELAAKVKDFQQFVKDNKLDFIKPDAAAGADRLKAALDSLRLVLEATKKDAQTAEKDIQSALKQGTISAVDAYGRIRDLKVALGEASVREAQQEAALEATKKNGADSVVKAKIKELDARKSIAEANAEYERKLGEDVAKIDKEGTAARVEELKKRGDFAEAYALQNADKIKALNLEIQDSSALLERAWVSDDAKKIASAGRVLAAALEAKAKFEASVGTMISADKVKAAEKEFSEVFSALNLSIEQELHKSAGGAGLSSIFDHALAAEKLYEAGIGKAIAKQKELQALATVSGRAEDQTKATAELKKLEEAAVKMRTLWVDVASSIGTALTDAFGKGGTALGQLISASVAYSVKEKQIQEDLEAARGGDPAVFAQKQIQASKDVAAAQVHSYATMIGAAQGFFNEGTKGYKVLGLAEKAFRIAEVAMALEAMVKKIFFKEGEVAANVALNAAKVTGEAASTAASTTLAGTEASAWGVTAVVKAIASMPFPLNLAAGAATLAAVIAIGAKVVGSIGSAGGGGTSAADVQKTQGAGGVFGDVSAKSDSINKSLDIISKNSAVGLVHTAGMLNALRAIQASMTGLTNLVLRTSGVTEGSNFGIATGQLNKGAPTDGMSSFSTALTNASFGPGLGSKLSSFLNNIWGKTTQNIVDSGLQFGGSIRNLEAGQGYNQYASVDTTKSSFFGLSKSTSNSVQVQGLNDELSKQFGMIFTNLEAALKAAATGLGTGADSVTKALDSLTIDTTKISLKGLTGTALTDALNAVLSKTMDQMAQAAFPEFDQFRKVGEGFAETVIRVADDVQQVRDVFAVLGKTMTSTGLDAAKSSEALITAAGGLDNLTGGTKAFLDGFMTDTEKLNPVIASVQARMTELGKSGTTTADQYKQLVLAQDLNTTGGQNLYAALIALAPQWQLIADAEKKIADQRRGIQDEIDTLTMTAAQLLEKQRNALYESNRSLWDNLQAIKAHNQALADAAAAETAAKAAAAAAAKQAFTDAMAGVDAAMAGVTRSVAAQKTELQTQYDDQVKLINAQHDAAKKAASDQLKIASDTANAIRSVFDSLSTTLTSVREMSRVDAQGVLSAALAHSNAGGSLVNFEGLDTALSTVTKPSEDMFASFTDFKRDQGLTAGTLAELKANAGHQVTVADMTVDAINKSIDAMDENAKTQLDALATQHTADVARLDNILLKAQQQVDYLKGIDNSTLSMNEALNKLVNAVAVAKPLMPPTNKPLPQSAFPTQLEAARFGGDAYSFDSVNDYKAKLQTVQASMNADSKLGVNYTLDQGFQLITGHSQAYWIEAQRQFDAGLHPTSSSIKGFAVGTNFVPYDMTANIHQGEAIIPAADNRKLLARLNSPAGDTAALEARIAALHAMLEAHLYAVAKSTRDTADTLDASAKGTQALHTVTP